jgi:hypothetical protein
VPIVERSVVSANLDVTGHVTVADPTGGFWTIYVVRPNEPRSPWVNLTSSYLCDLFVGRLARLVRRDRRWNVECAEGVADPVDRRLARVHSTEPSRTDAVAAATALASRLQEHGAAGMST